MAESLIYEPSPLWENFKIPSFSFEKIIFIFILLHIKLVILTFVTPISVSKTHFTCFILMIQNLALLKRLVNCLLFLKMQQYNITDTFTPGECIRAT